MPSVIDEVPQILTNAWRSRPQQLGFLIMPTAPPILRSHPGRSWSYFRVLKPLKDDMSVLNANIILLIFSENDTELFQSQP